jgi:HKD family nuclease
MVTNMVNEQKKKTVELVWNDPEANHLGNLKSLLASSKRFVCMTAFARESGFRIIEKLLKEGLKKGHEAFFVVGLDFFHTDPSVLSGLFELSKQHKLELFVSRPSWQSEGARARNFHPKIFIFEGEKIFVMIGSANMTGGGLLDNHEASVMMRDECREMSDGIESQIQQLIADRQIVPASPAILSEYGRRHAIYKAHERLTRWQVKRALENNDTQDLNLLRGYLAKMRADTSDRGFDADVARRKDFRKKSVIQLDEISRSAGLTRKRFLELYEPLVSELWHSGGLHRGKNWIADHARDFQKAVSALAAIKSPRIDQAFEILLKHILAVKGAGINVLTEILHSFDNRRFVVMNQNSVSGMALAGHTGFPRNPNKFDVDANVYVDFCRKAAQVRDRLGLRNFTELDSLFNYVYWNHPGA